MGVYVADVAFAMFTQFVLPSGERAHRQLMPEGPSSSSSVAVTSTRAWIVSVSVLSVTSPGSSTFSIVIVTDWVSSTMVDGLPRPSRPSRTSIVKL